MKSFLIYIIYFPNGKKYCGLTCNLRGRKDRHKAFAKNIENKTPIANAIRKYGFDNLKFEVIFSDLSREEANIKEIETIAELNLTDNRYGYNLDKGGMGGLGRKMSEATKEKIRKASKGINRCTPEQIKILSDLMSEKNNDSLFREKILEGQLKSKKYQESRRKIGIETSKRDGQIVICLNDGNAFPSLHAAANYYGLSRMAIKNSIKRNGRKNMKGLEFRLADEEEKIFLLDALYENS